MIGLFTKAKNATKGILGSQIATRLTDPNFYGALQFLPNPDVILRQLGQSQKAFDAIMLDPHVLGELRPMRANILTKKWRILPGGDKPEDMLAFELAKKVYGRPPVPTSTDSPGMGWSDVFWNMQTAILRGQRIHEVVWGIEDGLQVPQMVIDRPNHRFTYGTSNELRLLTQEHRVVGIPVDDYKFLVSRHMPDYDNPYGVALLSACFWPYTFKHNGFRFFTKFCEKYGIPWAIGKYPAGTAQAQINALADSLAAMVEDAVAAIPDSGAVELIQAGATGSQLPQERLIDVCNAEMSKAINSQTLASEITGAGSYAAAQTHRDREQDNGAADRKIIEATNNQLLVWMTELNFTGAMPPTFEFYDEAQARQDWADVLNTVRNYLDIPAAFAYQQLQIPQPVDGEPVLPKQPATAAPNLGATPSKSDFSALTDPVSPVGDYTRQLTKLNADPLKNWLEVIRKNLDEAKSLHDFQDSLLQMYGDLPSGEMTKIMALAYSVSDLAGRFDVEQGN